MPAPGHPLRIDSLPFGATFFFCLFFRPAVTIASAEIPSPRQLSAALSLQGRLRALMATPEFEAKHPRDEDGQFTEAGGGGGGGGDEGGDTVVHLDTGLGLEQESHIQKLTVSGEGGAAVDPTIREIAINKVDRDKGWTGRKTVVVTAAELRRHKEKAARAEKEFREHEKQKAAARAAKGLLAEPSTDVLEVKFRNDLYDIVHRVAREKPDGRWRNDREIIEAAVAAVGDDQTLAKTKAKMFKKRFRADFRGKLTPDAIRARLRYDIEGIREYNGGAGPRFPSEAERMKANAELDKKQADSGPAPPPPPPPPTSLREAAARAHARNKQSDSDAPAAQPSPPPPAEKSLPQLHNSIPLAMQNRMTERMRELMPNFRPNAEGLNYLIKRTAESAGLGRLPAPVAEAVSDVLKKIATTPKDEGGIGVGHWLKGPSSPPPRPPPSGQGGGSGSGGDRASPKAVSYAQALIRRVRNAPALENHPMSPDGLADKLESMLDRSSDGRYGSYGRRAVSSVIDEAKYALED